MRVPALARHGIMCLALILAAGGSWLAASLRAQPAVFQWARGAGGQGIQVGRGVSADDAGNVVVTGYFSRTASFGPVTLTGAGGSDMFLAKYAPSGEVVWVRAAGGMDGDGGVGVAVDSAGNVVATGRFGDTMRFGPVTLTSAGGSDMFVCKYSPSGRAVWAKAAGGIAGDHGSSVAVDQAGNVAVTGTFQETATFGPVTLTSEGSDDMFVAKYDSSGQVLWAQAAGGTDRDGGHRSRLWRFRGR